MKSSASSIPPATKQQPGNDGQSLQSSRLAPSNSLVPKHGGEETGYNLARRDTVPVTEEEPAEPRISEPLSNDSSPGFPDGVYFAADFMIGAGMVILQPSTGKVVVVNDESEGNDYWFLPKGRKDVGESLETAALREAYEESGYKAEFLPLYTPTNAPAPPGQRSRLPTLNTEPIYMSTHRWHRRRIYQSSESCGGEYVTFWFVGMIPADAQWHSNTGMQDEQEFRAYLFDYETAMEKLGGPQTLHGLVVQKAYQLWRTTTECDKSLHGKQTSDVDKAHLDA